MQHGFDVEHADHYGVEEAILIHSFQFWIDHNRANSQHFHDGRTWSYNTLQAFAKQFPYWTTKQVRRAVDSLVRQGVLVKGNYGAEEGWSVFNRTVWYAFADEGAFLVPLPAEEEVEPICPNGQMDVPQMDMPKRANLRYAQTGKSDLPKRANESKEAFGTPLGTACEVQQAGNARTCAPAREKPDPTACLLADFHTDEPTPTKAVSDGAALLLLPVAEGGAGFGSVQSAEKIASARLPDELRHWIKLAKKRGASNVAAFIVKRIGAGDPPPESYLKAVKASFRDGGGGVLGALGLGSVIGSSPALEKVRQQSGAPPGWDESDEPADGEEESDEPKSAPRRAEPTPSYFAKWRGHGG